MEENKPKVLVADHFDKVSEIIDKDGNKLDKIKGKIIAKKKEFNMSELGEDFTPNLPTVNTQENTKTNSLSEKIEKKINEKINELLDKKIDEIFSKMF